MPVESKPKLPERLEVVGSSIAPSEQVEGVTPLSPAAGGDREAREAFAREIARRYNLHTQLSEVLRELASGNLTLEQTLALARAASKLVEAREE